MTRDPHANEPQRLGAGSADDPVLGELGRMFSALPPAPPLDDAGRNRVARRLSAGDGLPSRSWRSPVLVVAFVVLASGAAATWGVPRLFIRHVEPFAPPLPSVQAPRAVPSTRVRASVAPPVPNAAIVTAEPTPAATSEPRTSVRPAPSPAPSASTAPSETELARESAALERALTALRRDRDPGRALSLLERYAADFPAGVLRQEADLARVDAHLALGQRAQALGILDRLPLERVGRGLELSVVRGELYADRDCARAVRDFDRVLAANPPASLGERALFGRASCRAHSGDSAGSRADLQRYLERYPGGRFAESARERLR